MFLPPDRDHHFIQTPFIGRLFARRPDTLRYLRAKFSDPCPNGFIAYGDAARGKEILNVPQAERKAMVCPSRVGNDGPWEAVTALSGAAELD